MWIELFTKNKIRKIPEPVVCYAAKFTLDLKDIQYKGRAIGRSENLGGGQVVNQGILKKNIWFYLYQNLGVIDPPSLPTALKAQSHRSSDGTTQFIATAYECVTYRIKNGSWHNHALIWELIAIRHFEWMKEIGKKIHG